MGIDQPGHHQTVLELNDFIEFPAILQVLLKSYFDDPILFNNDVPLFENMVVLVKCNDKVTLQ